MTPTRQLSASRQRTAVTPAINLPKSQATKHLTDDELAVVARLIRVTRQKNYWLGAYIEWLLEMDAGYPGPVSTDTATKMLGDIKGLNSWANWFEESPQERATILKYYGHRFFPDREDRLMDDVYGGDDPEFCNLVKMWRTEHPEPSPTRQIPSGRCPASFYVEGERPDEGEDDK